MGIYQVRIQEIIDEYEGGDRAAFIEKTGLPEDRVTYYMEASNEPTPKADFIGAIAATYKINCNWLILGIGPRELT